ncbi:ribosomal protein S18-alanine N-acetyltransferase [Clostridium sp. chh4-2]|uniref:ribosomal protein S18-alanine N-acetyltransferase n=1 Tax=Clostridium sp. chh4-2 TaxID=2067550 RepID=UPI001FA87D07|nr:ribosomal protein S18-alanine N-acetyltransferase [Clostridium sp. chh4-2]
MIRRMEVRDIDRVEELENACFHDPWSKKLLAQGLECSLDRYFVLEEDGLLKGYSVLRVIADEGEIQRIAVWPEMRRQGCGKKLMDAMVNSARENKVSDLILEVRAGNLGAISLYKSYGFQKEGERKNYYTGPTEDAWLMRLREICRNYQ